MGKHGMGVRMGDHNIGRGSGGGSGGGTRVSEGQGGPLDTSDLEQLPPCFVYLLADVGTPKERMLAFLRFTSSQLFSSEFSAPTWLNLTPNPVVHDYDNTGFFGVGLGVDRTPGKVG